MAEENCTTAVKCKTIRQVFETMEYDRVNSKTNLSKDWLQKNCNSELYSYIDKKDNPSKGTKVEVKDVQNDELLTIVYGPLEQDVPNIISQCADNRKWNLTKNVQKAVFIDRLANEIERHSTLFCQLEISLRGILSSDTKRKALPLLIDYLNYYASWAVASDKLDDNWKTNGIVVGIFSDDSFLAAFGFVLGPALAAGYNVILQTEPKISATAALIIELAENVGIPRGTIKLMPGCVNLNTIFSNKDVAIVSSFGNLRLNKYNVCNPLKKKFLAISNSKISMIVFNTADLDSACDSVIDAAWGYQGLLPWSLNTIIVQEDVFETFVAKLKYCLTKINISIATNTNADVSFPVINDPTEQLNLTISVAKSKGIEVYQNDSIDGAFKLTLLIGGKVWNNNVITENKDAPVVNILPFRNTNEAVNLSNNNRYGFGTSVWTENIGLANEVAGKLNVANVWINMFANFSADTTFTIEKESGIGYFGGINGFFEYIRIPNDTTECACTTRSGNNSNLPVETTNRPLQSFYGGSFKKSESGLIDGIFDDPVKKDLCNCVAGAKKGQVVWSKMVCLDRSRLLRKVADELISKKKFLCENIPIEEEILNEWITKTYESLAELSFTGSTSTFRSRVLKRCVEPLGIIAIEESTKVQNNFIAIIATLLLGNSVIVLNRHLKFAKFFVEICKIFTACNSPPGVFNVLLNCNDNIIQAALAHKELNAYFVSKKNKLFDNIKISELKRFYWHVNNWTYALYCTSKTKNVWSNVGDSVL